jgi:hypothetical protein
MLSAIDGDAGGELSAAKHRECDWGLVHSYYQRKGGKE